MHVHLYNLKITKKNFSNKQLIFNSILEVPTLRRIEQTLSFAIIQFNVLMELWDSSLKVSKCFPKVQKLFMISLYIYMYICTYVYRSIF